MKVLHSVLLILIHTTAKSFASAGATSSTTPTSPATTSTTQTTQTTQTPRLTTIVEETVSANEMGFTWHKSISTFAWDGCEETFCIPQASMETSSIFEANKKQADDSYFEIDKWNSMDNQGNQETQPLLDHQFDFLFASIHSDSKDKSVSYTVPNRQFPRLSDLYYLLNNTFMNI